MNIATIIPVRMAASRFPNKPFSEIQGLPMFHYVYNRVIKDYPKTFLAICDEEIETYCANLNLNFIKTSLAHQSGTDRIGEAISKIELKEKFSKVINIQGDMPFVTAQHINLLSKKINSFEMSTLCCPFNDSNEFQDTNKVKILVKKIDENYVAQNFFRDPSLLSKINFDTFHHVGLYGYQTSFLKNFLKMPLSLREKNEKLEQLRLKNLNRIGVSLIKENILGVDTKKDLIKVNHILKK